MLMSKVGSYAVLDKSGGKVGLYTLTNGHQVIHKAGVYAEQKKLEIKAGHGAYLHEMHWVSCMRISSIDIVPNFVTESDFSINSIVMPGRSRSVAVGLQCLRSHSFYALKLNSPFNGSDLYADFGSFVELFLPTGIATLKFTFCAKGDYFGIRLC